MTFTEKTNEQIRRNDTRDISPAELKLIRVGHLLLWLERRKALKIGNGRRIPGNCGGA